MSRLQSSQAPWMNDPVEEPAPWLNEGTPESEAPWMNDPVEEPAPQHSSVPDDAERLVQWADMKVPVSRIKDVAEKRGTSPEAIMRLGTWQGRLESRLAKSMPGQAALRLEQAGTDIATTVLSLGSRAGILPEEMTKNLHKEQKLREEFLSMIEEGGDLETALGERGSRIANNVIRSSGKMAASGALGGSTAILSTIGGETFDQSLEEADELGLEGAERVSFAGKKAIVETGTTFLLGRIGRRAGLLTAEEMLSPGIRNAAAKLAKDSGVLSRVGKLAGGAAAEAGEEQFIDAVSQLITNTETGEEFDLGRNLEAAVTGAAGAGTIGTIQGFSNFVNNKISEQKASEVVKGVKSAETAIDSAANPGALETETDQANLDRIRQHRVKGKGKTGERGSRHAVDFFKKSTPAMLEKMKPGMSQKEFAAATGLKKTSKTFRDAFIDTLDVYKTTPGVARKSSQESTTDGETTQRSPETEGSENANTGLSEGTTPTEVGNTDINPPAAVVTDNIVRIAGDAKTWLKENFSAMGLRNEVIDAANDARMGRVASEMKHAIQLAHDLDASVRKEFGTKHRLSPEVVRKLDDALKGQETDLPQSVMESIQPLRAHVDSLSRQMIDEGITDDALTIKFEEGIGMYVARKYRKHSDKSWVRRVQQLPGIAEKARNLLRKKHPDDLPEAIEWRLNALLDKDSAAARDNAPAQVVSDKDFIKRLKKRKDIPKELRELYGEYRDPWVNYTDSIADMANLLASHEFGKTIREAGIEHGFLSSTENPSQTTVRSENFRRIDGQSNPHLRELDGLYTTPELHRSLTELFSSEMQGGIYRALVKTTGYAKWAQTVGNTKTHGRNFLSNAMFAMANGDMFSRHWGKALNTVIKDITGSGDSDTRAYVRKMAGLGLLDSNVHVGILREMSQDMDSDRVTAAGPGVGALLKSGKATLSQIYQAGDAIWKINGFEVKKAQYARAFPDATTSEIELLAANDVKAHYPTFSKLSKSVRKLSEIPVMAPFISFPAEVVRVTKNTVNTIARDIKSENPHIRSMAQQRAIGMIASTQVIPVISNISKAIVGVDEEEEGWLRTFLAPWSQNSSLLYLWKDGKGEYTTVDLSFIDPRAILTKPLVAAFREGEPEEKAAGFIEEAASPFGEDLLMGKVFSYMRNSNPDSTRVYNPEASASRKAFEISNHFGQVLVPGTIQQLDRIWKGIRNETSAGGKPYDAALETAALLGLRVSSTDVTQSYGFRSSSLNFRIGDAEGGIRQEFTHRGTVTPGQLDRVYREYNGARKELFQKQHDTAMDAIRLGVPESEVRRQLMDRGVSKSNVGMIMAGAYMPYMPGKETLVTISKRPNGQERIRQLQQLYREALDDVRAERETGE